MLSCYALCVRDPSHKNLQKALNDITRKIETLDLNSQKSIIKSSIVNALDFWLVIKGITHKLRLQTSEITNAL